MKNNELIKRDTLNKISGMIGLGAGAGTVAAAGTAIGSAGLLGSIGSAVGLTVAVATPIGWILGGAAVGGAALYGASKVSGGKGYSDGNVAANIKFNSDIEKQMYQGIIKKLSAKTSYVAINLLNKLPANEQFIVEFKDDASNGLDKGTMDAKDVIKICCEFLNENYESYIATSQMTIHNIESFIKIATLFALCDADYSKEEKVLIRGKVINFFDLHNILSDVEINLIFTIALGDKEKIKSIKDLDYLHQINLLHTFILEEDNNELLVMILEFLEEVAKADGTVTEDEEVFISMFESMLISKANFIEGNYTNAINILLETDELFLPKNNDKFIKKLKNICSSQKAYGYCLSGQHIIAIDDYTLFGAGDEGFVFTPLGIFTDKSDLHFIPYTSFEECRDELKAINIDETDYFPKLIDEIISIGFNLSGDNEFSNEKEWHIAFSQKQLGHKSMQEINDLFESKEIEINDSCMVWKDGMDNWKKIEDVQELSVLVSKFKQVTPPPLPSTPPPLPN
jgi:hypothetical protein